eukprot:1089440-Prymnesium_polylepis.3
MSLVASAAVPSACGDAATTKPTSTHNKVILHCGSSFGIKKPHLVVENSRIDKNVFLSLHPLAKILPEPTHPQVVTQHGVWQAPNNGL